MMIGSSAGRYRLTTGYGGRRSCDERRPVVIGDRDLEIVIERRIRHAYRRGLGLHDRFDHLVVLFEAEARDARERLAGDLFGGGREYVRRRPAIQVRNRDKTRYLLHDTIAHAADQVIVGKQRKRVLSGTTST